MPALAITAVDHTTGQLTIPSHGLLTGSNAATGQLACGLIAAGGALPGGGALVEGADVFPIRVDANTIKLASSNANALAGTALSFSDNGSGQMYLLVGLPFRRPRNAAALTQVFSVDNNAVWDAMAGSKRPVLRRNIPLTLSFVDSTNTWAANGIGIKSTSATGTTTIAASYCDCPYEVGDVILGVEVWRKSDGTAGNKASQFILAAQDNNIIIATSTDTIANTSTTRTGPFVVAAASGIGRTMLAGETLHFAFVSSGNAGYIIVAAQLVVMRP